VDFTDLLLIVALAGFGYVCGSLPSGVIVARLTGGPDPRTIGSGRTGGTNALRALGRRRAFVVTALDVLKGTLPVLVVRLVWGDAVLEIACALGAVLGSSRSMFLGFGGGRGVATGVGTMLVIQPIAVLVAAPVFLLAILITRYVSLGSLLGSAVMALVVVGFWAAANGEMPVVYPLYTAIGAGLVWLAHADNIDRLLHGRERKFDLSLLRGRPFTG
jgi:glycerol-3-phosphate acyltransferase PlsY